MRNFKKFLALVLAMLMVSACAVSVAAFDDVADTDDYADAVELLANLGVISGRNDGTNNFYPNDTLTREEAAVIAAKVLAGAKAVEWTAATTRFADVVDAWSFAFINYVDDENVMVGNANGEFNPKGTLQIDEAIKIALAIADSKAAFNASVEMAKNPTMAWWTFYVQEANEIGLTDGIAAIRNYQAKCTRGMFAQLIYNAFYLVEEFKVNGETYYKYVNDLLANFGYEDTTAYVDVDDNGIVTLKPVDAAKDVQHQITAELLNEALKAAGYTETAADLEALNGQIYLSWLKTATDLKIVDVEVLTTGKVVKYNDADLKIENAYFDGDDNGKVETSDPDDLDKKYIVIDGVKYEVGVADDKKGNTVLGGADIETVGITVTFDGGTKFEKSVVKYNEKDRDNTGLDDLPKYFEAFLYDDDGDGDFERCNIVEYVVATVKVTAPSSSNGLKCDLYTVQFRNADRSITTRDVNDAKNEKAAKWAGETVTADEERPALIQKNWEKGDTVKVLELGAPVTGLLTKLIPGSTPAVVIDDTTYTYAASTYNVPEATSLKQTITIYTLNATEIVNVTKASFVTKVIVLDKATVNADGKVVLNGFDGTSFEKVEYVLDGQYSGGKYVAVAGHYDDRQNNDYAKLVFLGGSKKADGSWNEATGIKFAEGTYYEIVVTADGNYYYATQQVANPDYIEGLSGKDVPKTIDKTLDNFFTAEIAKNAKFALDSSYIYVNDIAKYYNKDNKAVIIIPHKATGEAANNAYSNTYTILTSLAAVEGATVKTNSDSTYGSDSKVSHLYIPTDYQAIFNKIENIAAGQTIVQILGKYIAADFDYYTYEVVDLLANKKDTVLSTSELTEGNFYIVEDGVVVEDTTGKWVREKGIMVEQAEGSLTKKYFAWPTYIANKDDDGNPVFAYAEKKEFSKIMITVYETKDGIIAFNDDGTPKTLSDVDNALTANKNNQFDYAFVVEGKIIIVK